MKEVFRGKRSQTDVGKMRHNSCRNKTETPTNGTIAIKNKRPQQTPDTF